MPPRFSFGRGQTWCAKFRRDRPAGRALNRETEAIAALKQAEVDRSSFCLENDPIASALLAFLCTVESFPGTASDLVPKLVEIDPEPSVPNPLSARKLGKRIVAIWRHLQSKLTTASKEPTRNGFTVFHFAAAKSAEFKRTISENSCWKHSHETLSQTAIQTRPACE